MGQFDTSTRNKIFRDPSWKLNWPTIRKLETLIFASMLLAVPLIAFKVMRHTTSAMTVRQCSVDLVKDLIKAKELARELGVPVTLNTHPGKGVMPYSYELEKDGQPMATMEVSRGVACAGSVTFDQTGAPVHPATFILSNGPEVVSVEVDAKGMISAH